VDGGQDPVILWNLPPRVTSALRVRSEASGPRPLPLLRVGMASPRPPEAAPPCSAFAPRAPPFRSIRKKGCHCVPSA
jgi:hypothetical protein